MTERYYDKDGTVLSDVLFWAKKYGQQGYKRVAETTLSDGKWVSTVWLGRDHNFIPGGKPLIFETMVFQSEKDLSEVDMERYSTLLEAEEGHRRMVKKWDKP